VLRPWRVADAPVALAAVEQSLPQLRRFMPWAMVPPTLRSMEAFLEGVVAGDSIGFGLYEADGALVGGCGLHDRRGPGTFEMGYWVRSDRTGRGYATAAARALTSTVFEVYPDIDRVEIRCDPANLASMAIPRKLGYRIDSEVEVEVEAAAQTGRQVVWAATRDMWVRSGS
jgi:RimJ/RimL family protein N-acetyltransferase